MDSTDEEEEPGAAVMADLMTDQNGFSRRRLNHDENDDEDEQV